MFGGLASDNVREKLIVKGFIVSSFFVIPCCKGGSRRVVKYPLARATPTP